MSKLFEFPEGATPINDCSGLIPHWVTVLHDLNRVEAENILKAQLKYLREPIKPPQNWFSITELKKIHYNMFGEVWEWAGTFRKSTTSIGINPSLIAMKLSEFCYELNTWLKNPVELTFLEIAARIHHQLVYIHPFENGNGRFSRLVADRFLFSLKGRYPIWPNQLNSEGIVRKNYIKTLKKADQGDFNPLLKLMKNCGAKEPNLKAVLYSPFFKHYRQKEKGAALIKALLRTGDLQDYSLEEALSLLI